MKRIFLLLILFCWNAYSYVYFPFNPNAALPGVDMTGPGLCSEPTTYQLTDLNPFYKPGIQMVVGVDNFLNSPTTGARYDMIIRYYNGSNIICPVPFACEFGAWNHTVAPAGATSVKLYTQRQLIPGHSCDLPIAKAEVRASPGAINGDFRTIGIESIYLKQNDREYCIDKPFHEYLAGKSLYLKQNVPTEFGIKFREDLRQISFDLSTAIDFFHFSSASSQDYSTYHLSNSNIDANGNLKFNFIAPTVPANVPKNMWSVNARLRGRYSNNIIDEYLQYGLYALNHYGDISFEEMPVVTDSPEVTIAQFFKDPRDEQGNSIVSSGKNLDIEVQSGFDVGENIAGTELKIKNLNTNSYLSQTYFPTSNNVLTGGLVKFEINTLPDFNRDTDVQFEINIKFDNKCRPGKLSKLFVKRSRILKSNSFNVLFVKVAPEVDGQFESADQSKYLNTLNKTKDYFKLIGLVSDKKINFSETKQSVYYKANFTLDQNGIEDDLKKLNSMISQFKPKKSFVNNQNPDLIVGVTSDDYFSTKDLCIFVNGKRVCGLGVSLFNIQSILVQQEQIPVVMHEFGHVLCTRYDGLRSCDKNRTSGTYLNKDATHSDTYFSLNSPYSNYTDSELGIRRGHISNPKNLMSTFVKPVVGNDFSVTGEYWPDDITFHSMLSKFSPNLASNILKLRTLESDSVVNISANIDSTGYFFNINNLITNDSMYVDQCENQGTYRIDFIDERDSVLKSCWHNPTERPHGVRDGANIEQLVINMRYRYPLKTVKILIRKNTDLVYTWYLSTSSLTDMLKHISRYAYKNSAEDFKNKYLRIIKSVNNSIDSGNISSANSILLLKLRKLINEELTQNYIPESIEKIGLYEMQQALLYSFLSTTTTGQNENSFFKLISYSDRNEIFINRKKGIDNPNYTLKADVYLDSEYLTTVGEKDTEKIFKPIEFSGKIKLLSYMIDKKIYHKFSEVKKLKQNELDYCDKNLLMLKNYDCRNKIISETLVIESIIEKNKIYLDKIILSE